LAAEEGMAPEVMARTSSGGLSGLGVASVSHFLTTTRSMPTQRLGGWGTNGGILPSDKPPRPIAACQHVERHLRERSI